MKVSELITFLQTLPGDLPIGYRCYSEMTSMDIRHMEVMEVCAPRSDGWLQRKRPDMESVPYLIFPGN